MPVESLYPVNLVLDRASPAWWSAVARSPPARWPGCWPAGRSSSHRHPGRRRGPRHSASRSRSVPTARGDVAGYRLVVAATDDPAVNRAVFDDGEAAGVWVNSADDPASCSFTLPAVVRRGPIMVTVSTGGHSPALASWLRTHVERELGPEYEDPARAAVGGPAMNSRPPGARPRGSIGASALDSDMLELIRAGQTDRARERLQACLSSS